MSVVGGRPAAAGAHPWMAALLEDTQAEAGRAAPASGRFSCGGSLIAPSIVLTAAHCVTDDDGRPQAAAAMQVLLGRTVLDGEGGEVIDIARFAVDPDYDPRRIRHDVALLQLATPSAAAPVALAGPKLRLREGQTGTALGWGLTVEDGAPSPILLEASLPLWSNARCTARYENFIIPHDPGLMICAATPRSGRDVCDGDSGGPLLVTDAGTPKLVGVTSWADGCARPRTASNFAWVSSPHHLGWIVRKGNAMIRGDADAQPPVITGASGAGGRVRYTVGEAAQVVVAVKARRGRRTVTYATALVQNAQAGANSFPMPRTLRGVRLRPGRYVLEAVATDAAGNRSQPVLIPVSAR